jgi:hypothetical protein
MPAPVLSHNLRPAKQLDIEQLIAAPGSSTSSAPSGASYGRGLYGKKLGSERPVEQAEPGALPVARAPRTVLRWQYPLRYLIVWQRHGLTLTWHAPWCRQCDCPGAGWRFGREGGYFSGLGFELSYLKE